jgi:hypothetical protein
MTQAQLTSIAENPRAWLSRAFRTQERITGKRERIESWRRHAESITAQLKPNGGSGGGGLSKLVETAVCNIVDLEAEIEEEIKALVAIEQEIQEAIDVLVVDTTEKALLEFRYINHLKWEEIAGRLNFAFRWTMTIHQRALEKISKKAC